MDELKILARLANAKGRSVNDEARRLVRVSIGIPPEEAKDVIISKEQMERLNL